MNKVVPLPEIIHNKLIRLYKLHLFTGGMPEVVKSYVNQKDTSLAREIQNDILEAYQRDFSKYTEKSQAIKTSEFWQSIPNQLARENKKFKYNDVRKKGRASYYGQTIEWLRKAGLIQLAFQVSVPKIPLAGYADRTKFKVYLLDTGLLGAMLNLQSDIILSPIDIFREYNGAFVENFVAQELTSYGNIPLYYWSSKSDADKYQPELVFRVSPRNFIQSGKFINVPFAWNHFIDSFVISKNDLHLYAPTTGEIHR